MCAETGPQVPLGAKVADGRDDHRPVRFPPVIVARRHHATRLSTSNRYAFHWTLLGCSEPKYPNHKRRNCDTDSGDVRPTIGVELCKIVRTGMTLARLKVPYWRCCRPFPRLPLRGRQYALFPAKTIKTGYSKTNRSRSSTILLNRIQPDRISPCRTVGSPLMRSPNTSA